MNLKNTLLGLVAISGFTLWADESPISNVSVSVSDTGHAVEISYELGGTSPMIVTMDILTNGVSVGANLSSLSGEINCKLNPGRHVVFWRSDKEPWAGLPAGVPAVDVQTGLRVMLSAWTEANPPPYRVVDLRSTNVPVRYYGSEAALPGGIDNGVYRDYKLLLRRVPAGGVTFRMGAPADEPRDEVKDSAIRETLHEVEFSSDYYIGVFEMTQRQYGYLSSTIPGEFTGFADSWLRPVNGVNYNAIRGSTDAGIDWPTTGRSVGEGSVLGKLRELTGIEFDLPTDAQWEYACRGGAAEACALGCPIYDNMHDDAPGFATVAWYTYNFRGNPLGDGIRPVGTRRPNVWGLYDMQGNADELCLDWIDLNVALSDAKDPAGPTSGSLRVCRGGNWGSFASTSRTAARRGVDPAGTLSGSLGLRVVCPLGNVW